MCKDFKKVHHPYYRVFCNASGNPHILGRPNRPKANLVLFPLSLHCHSHAHRSVTKIRDDILSSLSLKASQESHSKSQRFLVISDETNYTAVLCVCHQRKFIIHNFPCQNKKFAQNYTVWIWNYDAITSFTSFPLPGYRLPISSQSHVWI